MKRKKAVRRAPAKKVAAKRGTAKKTVQPIPAGYHAVTPYLAIKGAADAIEFYKKAFGAKEKVRMPGPDGKVGHAEVEIGDSRIMLTGEYAAMNFLSPVSRGGTTVTIHLYVKDCDALTAAWARCRIRSATSGTSPRTPKTCRWPSSGSARRR